MKGTCAGNVEEGKRTEPVQVGGLSNRGGLWNITVSKRRGTRGKVKRKIKLQRIRGQGVG
jgi:hypothetical protein